MTFKCENCKKWVNEKVKYVNRKKVCDRCEYKLKKKIKNGH